MRKALLLGLICVLLGHAYLAAQEANSGLDLRATFTGQFAASDLLTQPPRSGDPATAGFRSVIYPTIKFNSNWSVTGAWQLTTRPYFYSSFSTVGYGANGNLLHATLNYSRISGKGSLLLRAGQLSSSFGSFLLRYDDADNSLADFPLEYGYYYAPVSFLSVAGAQIDATRGKWDGRVQFANSSPANPRSLLDHDQYGNWACGGGYTIRQGFRIGGSAYHGPYLDRQYAYFFPGEANPSTLPAHAYGVDVAWAYGHWNVQGEFQRFYLPYTVIPSLTEQAAYGELKRVINPRWYIADRSGYTNTNYTGNLESYEQAVGFRPNRFQLIKVSYELRHAGTGTYRNNQIFAIQFVTTLHKSAAIN
jgi:hypothetical protein